MKECTESTRDSAYSNYSAYVMQGNTQSESDCRTFQAGLENGGYSSFMVGYTIARHIRQLISKELPKANSKKQKMVRLDIIQDMVAHGLALIGIQ